MPSSPDPGGELRPPFPYAAPRRRRGELLTGFAVRIRTRWGVRQRDLELSPGFQTPRTQLLDHGKNERLVDWRPPLQATKGPPGPGAGLYRLRSHSRVSHISSALAVSRPEGPAPRARSGAGCKNSTRPHKTS